MTSLAPIIIATGMVLAAQAPPMPTVKPIVAPPMPKPGEGPRKPSPEASTTSPGILSKGRVGAPAAQTRYGTTPAPWPSGSTDPRHFPKDIPRVPEASVAAYSTSSTSAMAFFICKQSAESVAALYVDFLTREKWERVSFPGPPLDKDRCIIGRKGDWTLRVDAGPNPINGRTEVYVNVILRPLAPAKPKNQTLPSS